MEIWNKLVGKIEALLSHIDMKGTVTFGGREIHPLVMGFALITVCIPVWGYLEIEAAKTHRRTGCCADGLGRSTTKRSEFG